MEIVFTLCLPRDEASVPIVRHVCRDSLQMLGVLDDCIADIELAVTEACTNVLKHVAVAEGEYEVSIEIDDERCHVRVIDSAGTDFDHAAYGVTDPLVGAEGGRGIFLMRAMVDDLTFTSGPGDGSAVHLHKLLDLEDSSILRRVPAH